MRLIIAGGRDYRLHHAEQAFLDEIHSKYTIVEVVSGACRGVDEDGEQWAKSKNIPIVRFAAEWGRRGKGAGPIRNTEMAKYADAVALFPGGKGTADMKRKAILEELKIFQFPGVIE